MQPIELRRKLSCPHCRLYGWHTSYIQTDLETNICHDCDWRWIIHYQETSKLYDQLLQTQIGRVEFAISNALQRLSTHSWSINQGVRDRDALQNIHSDLQYALSILKTFSGE